MIYLFLIFIKLMPFDFFTIQHMTYKFKSNYENNKIIIYIK